MFSKLISIKLAAADWRQIGTDLILAMQYCSVLAVDMLLLTLALHWYEAACIMYNVTSHK